MLFDENDMTVLLKDGRKLSVPLAYFPRLLPAATGDLKNYTLSGGGIGIHWDSLDEDIASTSSKFGKKGGWVAVDGML